MKLTVDSPSICASLNSSMPDGPSNHGRVSGKREVGRPIQRVPVLFMTHTDTMKHELKALRLVAFAELFPDILAISATMDDGAHHRRQQGTLCF